jgi:hypothetical protein
MTKNTRLTISKNLISEAKTFFGFFENNSLPQKDSALG